ncbi:MAG: hypothetical protein A4E30_00793 [Methanomassiliicoccales archaeon PtaB.Bin215]|nr:MAG: hypothetical protein A4E30_00793 [Methanomassiliicoccales archaeon PtaB.Bin215]
MTVLDEGVPSSSKGMLPLARGTVPSSTMVISGDPTFFPTMSVRNDRLLTISSASEACPMTSWARSPEMAGSVMHVSSPDGAFSAVSIFSDSLPTSLPKASRSVSLTTS